MKRERDGRQKVLMLASVASMVGQFNMQNIRLLQKMGYEVHVACNFKKGNTCDAGHVRELLRTLHRMRVSCYQWDCPRNAHALAACLRAYRELSGLLGRVRFAWIHCHSPVGGVLARLAAHRRGIRVIYTAHGFHFYQGAPVKNWLLYYPIEKLLAHWTDVLLTVNREDYRFAKRNLRARKIYWMPGVGVDLERFAPMRNQAGNRKDLSFCSRFGIPQNAVVLLSVGELNKGKNHRLAIQALSALGRKDVFYLVCGQGALAGKLQRYADRAGVGAQVRFPGYQGNMPWIYRNADIFVFPSKREGMPVALMEAMAAGLPCVVSDIRGNRELVPYANVNPRRPAQLTRMLRRLLEDGRLRMEYGRYNQKKICGYSQKEVERRMRKVYGLFESRADAQGQRTMKKKILHVLKMDRYSGAENVAITICRVLKGQYEFAYACPDGPIRWWLEKEGIRFYPMARFTLGELHKVLRQYQPDLVHAHDFSVSVYCGILKKREVLLSHLHNDPCWIRAWGFRSFCYRVCRQRFDRILLVSGAIQKEAVFLRKQDGRAVEIGNPIDQKRICQQAGEFQAQASDLLYVGRFTAQKNPLRFIRVVSRLQAGGLNVRALMVGDGELFVDCKNQIKKSGIESAVRMAGFCKNPYPYIRQAKLLLITSDWEGYGMVAAEALALGIPVLATAVGGLHAVLRDYPPALCRSETELYRKAKRLLADRAYYKKYRGQLLAKVRIPDMQAYMDAMKQIYG